MHATVNGVFRYILLKITNKRGVYNLNGYRRGGTLNIAGSPVPVTLTIGGASGSAQMPVTFC